MDVKTYPLKLKLKNKKNKLILMKMNETTAYSTHYRNTNEREIINSNNYKGDEENQID